MHLEEWYTDIIVEIQPYCGISLCKQPEQNGLFSAYYMIFYLYMNYANYMHILGNFAAI